MNLSLPASSGSYALHLTLPAAQRIAVGRLGAFDFLPGSYLYLGSAHGPGGLRGRIQHHLHPAERPHWHIDWLRRHTALIGGWYSQALVPAECLWSQGLLGLPGIRAHVPGFGASDCPRGCPAHLVYLPHPFDPIPIEHLLRSITPDLAVFA